MGNTFTACVGIRRPSKKVIVSHEPFHPDTTQQSGVIRTIIGTGSGTLTRSLSRLTRQTSQFTKNPPAPGFFAEDRYEQNPPDTSRGKVVIVAMEDFDPAFQKTHNLRSHSSVAKDSSDLKELFESAGYLVDLRRNPTTAEIRNVMKSYAKDETLSSVDSFLVVVLTEKLPSSENCGDRLAFYDTYLPRRKLISPLKRSQVLFGVPKIFVIQGISCETEPSGEAESSNVKFFQNTKPPGKDIPEEPDFLLVNSSSTHMYCSKDPQLGTYFVQKLVSLLRFNAIKPELDLLRLLIRLNENLRIADRKKEKDGEEDDCNGVCIVSTLRKEFHVFRVPDPVSGCESLLTKSISTNSD